MDESALKRWRERKRPEEAFGALPRPILIGLLTERGHDPARLAGLTDAEIAAAFDKELAEYRRFPPMGPVTISPEAGAVLDERRP